MSHAIFLFVKSGNPTLVPCTFLESLMPQRPQEHYEHPFKPEGCTQKHVQMILEGPRTS